MLPPLAAKERSSDGRRRYSSEGVNYLEYVRVEICVFNVCATYMHIHKLPLSIYIYIHMQTCTYIYIHIYMSIDVYVCTYACREYRDCRYRQYIGFIRLYCAAGLLGLVKQVWTAAEMSSENYLGFWP